MAETTYKVSLKHNDSHNAELLNKLYKYHLEGTLVDTIFISSDYKQIKTHSLVLSAMSSFFHELFKLKIEGIIYIMLPDFTFEMLKNFLEFLYKGTITLTEESLEGFLKLIQYFHIEGVDNTKIMDKNQNTCSSNGDDNEADQIWRPPSPSENIIDLSYTDDDTQLNTSSEIERLKKLTIPLKSINATSKSPDEIVNTTSGSTSTDALVINLKRLQTDTNKIPKEKTDTVSNIDKSNLQASQMNESVQLIDDDIPIVILNDSEMFPLENPETDQNTRKLKKRVNKQQGPIKRKISKYKNLRFMSTDSSSSSEVWDIESDTSSDELICSASRKDTDANKDLHTDDLFLKSLELMKNK